MESVWFATHQPTTAETQPLEAGTHFDTLVAGAGLTGLTTALLLARAGQKVGVLEARRIGAVTTGHTTAKVSLLQGLTLSDVLAHQSEEVLRAYVDANREGQAWLLRLLDDHGVDYQRRTAYTYATTDDSQGALRAELDASRRAGLDVEWLEETELPFPVTGAIALRDQAQIHPLEVLDALVRELREHGGTVVEGVRVTDANLSGSKGPLQVATPQGEVTADRLVLATGTPVLDRGGYFAKLVPMRSYATAHRVAGGTTPRGMYLSIDQPTRSLRTLPVGDEELLIVGGNGHVAGRHSSTQDLVDDLGAWTREHFPGAQMTHAWSAQDYMAADRVPYVGVLPRGGGRIYVATGFNKWGMTNAVAAGLNLSGQILEGHMPWAETLSRRSTTPASIVSALSPNLQVAYELAKDWVQAELQHLPDGAPEEGQGVVGRSGGKPHAVSTVDGVTCKLSAVCTHLGGIVRWNDAEKSWDCPLHGSRFAADGTLLEGPAVHDLARAD